MVVHSSQYEIQMARQNGRNINLIAKGWTASKGKDQTAGRWLWMNSVFVALSGYVQEVKTPTVGSIAELQNLYGSFQYPPLKVMSKGRKNWQVWASPQGPSVKWLTWTMKRQSSQSTGKGCRQSLKQATPCTPRLKSPWQELYMWVQGSPSSSL